MQDGTPGRSSTFSRQLPQAPAAQVYPRGRWYLKLRASVHAVRDQRGRHALPLARRHLPPFEPEAHDRPVVGPELGVHGDAAGGTEPPPHDVTSPGTTSEPSRMSRPSANRSASNGAIVGWIRPSMTVSARWAAAAGAPTKP